MNYLAILAAGIAYFLFGGLWFSPLLFERQWDKAIGFSRPDKWKATAIFFVGPLAGCLVASFATAFLLSLTRPKSVGDAALLGFVVGIGYGGAITGINAISPTARRPALLTAVTGTYHGIGLMMCYLIHYAWM